MTDRLFVRVNKEILNKLNECTQELKLFCWEVDGEALFFKKQKSMKKP